MEEVKITKLDKLFSEFIRKRAIADAGGCERCLTPKFDTARDDGSLFPAWMLLQCAHMCGKDVKNIRWDPDNAFGLCGGCHLHIDSHKDDKTEFHERMVGKERADLVKARSRVAGKYVDENAIWLYLEGKLRELNDV